MKQTLLDAYTPLERTHHSGQFVCGFHAKAQAQERLFRGAAIREINSTFFL